MPNPFLFNQSEVGSASKPNQISIYLAIASVFTTALFAFAAGVAFSNYTQDRTALYMITETSKQARQFYYLNQDAIEQCQQNFKLKSGIITCPDQIVVPSK